jgi:uncharacterized membrane protein
MTNKVGQRSAALLAALLLIGCAGAAHAANGASWIPQAEPRAEIRMVAADQLSDADRAAAPAQMQAAPAADDAQQDTQTQDTQTQDTQAQSQSAAPVVASSADGQSSDTSKLIGKIFIGFGTLLTVGCSAARMLVG